MQATVPTNYAMSSLVSAEYGTKTLLLGLTMPATVNGIFATNTLTLSPESSLLALLVLSIGGLSDNQKIEMTNIIKTVSGYNELVAIFNNKLANNPFFLEAIGNYPAISAEISRISNTAFNQYLQNLTILSSTNTQNSQNSQNLKQNHNIYIQLLIKNSVLSTKKKSGDVGLFAIREISPIYIPRSVWNNESWTWYWDSDRFSSSPFNALSIVDAPFLAISNNNDIAIGSPVHINYIAEFYDSSGNLINTQTSNNP